MTNNYFDNYLDLFQHPGWKQMMQETQEVFDTLHYENCKEHKDFLSVQATRQQLQKLLRFEELIRLSLQQLDEEKDDDDTL
tara:strand:+ start:121 stop:363 length:243 start_codon:yes stop_codon:yes gene_type:complete